MKWDLTNYYKTYDDFIKSLEEAKKIIEILKTYKGTLGDELKLKEYLDYQIDIVGKYEKLYLYAECAMDIDQRNTSALSDMQKVMFLFNSMSEATSFEDSEILSLGEDYILSVINKYSELKQFEFGLKNLFRQKEHTPKEEAQKVIANFSSLLRSGSDTYDSLSNGDIKEHIIKLDNGKDVNIMDANWSTLIAESKSASERKRIFEAEFERYEYNKNTYASLYKSVLNADIGLAKSRGFKSALEMHLYHNNIPLSLYHNLIEIAHKAAPTVKKYLALRKKVLGLDEYHTYDRFLDLVEDDNESKFTYEEAKELFFKSIEKFPQEFKNNAMEALKDGYVDVMPGLGKRSGAYSNSTPNTHPCILLNFTGNLDSCFTLAHEAGHSIHSLFSMAQPTMTQSYTIFVAEIASTFNEHNLLDYLLSKGTLSKNEKIKLIQNAIDGIISTFYRQTQFAEYEYLAHKKALEGEAITEDSLSDIFIKLYDEYYGIDINKEKVKKYVWAYVSHFFHSPYYVYQYATSYSASLAIYNKVKNNEEGAFEKYINLLKSGGSDYPIELVKQAGVDFTKTDALDAVVIRLEELLEELGKAINE